MKIRGLKGLLKLDSLPSSAVSWASYAWCGMMFCRTEFKHVYLCIFKWSQVLVICHLGKTTAGLKCFYCRCLCCFLNGKSTNVIIKLLFSCNFPSSILVFSSSPDSRKPNCYRKKQNNSENLQVYITSALPFLFLKSHSFDMTVMY